jgi:hypothetical protein
MSLETLTSKEQIFHYGPVRDPDRKSWESRGLCHPDIPSVLTKDKKMVNCEKCLAMLAGGDCK